MAKVLVNFRIDKKDKVEMEKVCKELGLSMSTAFNIFARRVAREHKMPFNLELDPFYSEENQKELRQAIKDYKAGRNFHEHELIDVD